MTVLPLPTPTFRLSQVLDTAERVLILILYGWLVWRFADSLVGKPGNLLVILSEGVIALMVLFRRPTDDISLRPMDWFTGILGTALPMLVHPSAGGSPAGAMLMAAGLIVSLGAKLSLRRSFGVIAANRGVKRTGLYAIVRHPMYLGYLLTYVGVMVLNPNVWNGVLLLAWFAFEIARIHAEERVLMRDPAYQDHAKAVRFRLIPGIW